VRSGAGRVQATEPTAVVTTPFRCVRRMVLKNPVPVRNVKLPSSRTGTRWNAPRQPSSSAIGRGAPVAWIVISVRTVVPSWPVVRQRPFRPWNESVDLR
jgi:hypothetical protein